MHKQPPSRKSALSTLDMGGALGIGKFNSIYSQLRRLCDSLKQRSRIHLGWTSKVWKNFIIPPERTRAIIFQIVQSNHHPFDSMGARSVYIYLIFLYNFILKNNFQIFIPKRHNLDALAVNIQIYCNPVIF